MSNSSSSSPSISRKLKLILGNVNPENVDWIGLKEMVSSLNVSSFRLPLRIYELLMYPFYQRSLLQVSEESSSLFCAWFTVLTKFLAWQRPVDLDSWIDFLITVISAGKHFSRENLDRLLEYHEKRIIPEFSAKKVFESSLSSVKNGSNLMRCLVDQRNSEIIVAKTLFPQESRDSILSIFSREPLESMEMVNKHFRSVFESKQSAYQKQAFIFAISAEGFSCFPVIFQAFCMSYPDLKGYQMQLLVLACHRLLSNPRTPQSIMVMEQCLVVLAKYRSYLGNQALMSDICSGLLAQLEVEGDDCLVQYLNTIIMGLFSLDLNLVEDHLNAVLRSHVLSKLTLNKAIITSYRNARKCDVLISALFTLENNRDILDDRVALMHLFEASTILTETTLVKLFETHVNPIIKSNSSNRKSKKIRTESEFNSCFLKLILVIVRSLQRIPEIRLHSKWHHNFGSDLQKYCFKQLKNFPESVTLVIELLTAIYECRFISFCESKSLIFKIVNWISEQGLSGPIVAGYYWVLLHRKIDDATKSIILKWLVSNSCKNDHMLSLLFSNLACFLKLADSGDIRTVISFILKQANTGNKLAERFLAVDCIFENSDCISVIVEHVLDGKYSVDKSLTYVPIAVFVKRKVSRKLVEAVANLECDGKFIFSSIALAASFEMMQDAFDLKFLVRLVKLHSKEQQLLFLAFLIIRHWIKIENQKQLQKAFDLFNFKSQNELLSFMNNLLMEFHRAGNSQLIPSLLQCQGSLKPEKVVLDLDTELWFNFGCLSKTIFEGKTKIIDSERGFLKDQVFRHGAKAVDLYLRCRYRNGGKVKLKKRSFETIVKYLQQSQGEYEPRMIGKLVFRMIGIVDCDMQTIWKLLLDCFGLDLLLTVMVSDGAFSLQLIPNEITENLITNFPQLPLNTDSLDCILSLSYQYLRHKSPKNLSTTVISAILQSIRISISCGKSLLHKCYLCLYELAKDRSFLHKPIAGSFFDCYRVFTMECCYGGNDEKGLFPCADAEAQHLQNIRNVHRLTSVIFNPIKGRGMISKNRTTFSKTCISILYTHLSSHAYRQIVDAKRLIDDTVFLLLNSVTDQDLQHLSTTTLGTRERSLLKSYRDSFIESYKYKGKF